jgi:hypothetical protein
MLFPTLSSKKGDISDKMKKDQLQSKAMNEQSITVFRPQLIYSFLVKKIIKIYFQRHFGNIKF